MAESEESPDEPTPSDPYAAHDVDLAFDDLDKAINDDDRVGAIAALATATAAMNALALVYDNEETLPVPDGVRLFYGQPQVFGIAGWGPIDKVIHWKNKKDPDWIKKQREWIRRLSKSVDDMVREFGPDQYAITGGFPIGVSVTLTWNVKKSKTLDAPGDGR